VSLDRAGAARSEAIMSSRKAKRLQLETNLIPFPGWRSQRDAIALVGALLPAWLRAFEDVSAAGIPVPPLALLDLGRIAEALSDSIGSGAGVETSCISDEYLGEIAAVAHAYSQKVCMGSEDSFTGADGRVHIASAQTLVLLCQAVEHAAHTLAQDCLEADLQRLCEAEARQKLVDRAVGLRRQLRSVSQQREQLEQREVRA
jgi:hypothetical protein